MATPGAGGALGDHDGAGAQGWGAARLPLPDLQRFRRLGVRVQRAACSWHGQAVLLPKYGAFW